MKYGRLSWNSNNWFKPSGCNGKSISSTTFEGLYGFGLEEWLFDNRSLTDKQYFGYIEGFKWVKDTQKEIFVNLYTLSYPTIDSPAIRNFVTKLKVSKVDYLENRSIIQKWKKSGRIDTMRNEIHAVCGRLYAFDDIVKGKDKVSQLVNVKFEVMPNINLVKVPAKHFVNNYQRFRLINDRNNK
jgi:hypothetical protein